MRINPDLAIHLENLDKGVGYFALKRIDIVTKQKRYEKFNRRNQKHNRSHHYTWRRNRFFSSATYYHWMKLDRGVRNFYKVRYACYY